MKQPIPFQASMLAMLAMLAAAGWAPAGGWTQPLDLAQSPPAMVEPFVAPNVILSLDDSGSMQWRLTTNSQGIDQVAPNANGSWHPDVNRASVLRNALTTVFSDQTLLPDGSIRLAWQTMGDCATNPWRYDYNRGQWFSRGQNYSQRVSAETVDSNLHDLNAMRRLDADHRANFLEYISFFQGCVATPTHAMVARADAYFRGNLGRNSPWAFQPGEQDKPFLGCRRNYHILMTDGGWNDEVNVNQIPSTATTRPNIDGTDRIFPDGTPYTATNAQTRIYRDNDVGDNTTRNVGFSTVADWAFRSWADPLQNPADLEGRVTTGTNFRNAPATETFTSRATGAAVTLDRYWNPRHNPATWPHMTTFTIGFSQYALPQSNYAPNGTWQNLITAPSTLLPYAYDGNFADYANGSFAWRSAGGVIGGPPRLPSETAGGRPVADRGHDMWHAALNGRGQFYAVNRSEDLATAFRQIVQQINVEAEPDRSSAATSGSTITRSAVGLYTANYDPQKAWKGWITGETVATTTGQGGKPATTTAPASGWQGKSTADRLDDLSDAQLGNRPILGWNDDTGRGVPFRWDRIGAAQQARLNRSANGAADSLGSRRLDYLRGVRSTEGTASPPSYPASRPFRQRQSRQGDIINSAIWYTGIPSSLYPAQAYKDFASTHKARTPMIYVGGNGGMLHGFSAEDGTEKIAYVPRGVTPSLPLLTDPGYDDRHRYFVDGSPMTGDVQDGNQWKTVLVGTLGAGGKGYFVLDVTNPADFQEARANAQVLLDRSMHATENRPADCSLWTDAAARNRCEADKDIGHVFAAPVLDDSDPQRSTQITRLNNDRWAVVMGNGYNSQSGRSVLLIQYLDGNRELLRLPAPAGAPRNGLSAPRLVDINADGRPDVAYAGDRQGNLWKFIIASDDPGKWHVAFDGKPLFSVAGQASGANEESITAAPTVRANDRRQVVKNSAGLDETQTVGGMMVAFGTGRNVTTRDPLAPRPGTIYSVLDNTRYKLVGQSLVEPCLSTSDADCKLRADQVPAPVRPSQLVSLSESTPSITLGQGVSTGRSFSKVDGGGVDWATHRGWSFRLPVAGERLLKSMSFYDSSNILAIFSQVPARPSGPDAGGTTAGTETCDATTVNGERQWLTLLNIMDGKRPSVQLLDASGDGVYSAADKDLHRMTTFTGAHSQVLQGDRIVFKGGKGEEDVLARMPEQPVRPSWRQLQ